MIDNGSQPFAPSNSTPVYLNHAYLQGHTIIEHLDKNSDGIEDGITFRYLKDNIDPTTIDPTSALPENAVLATVIASKNEQNQWGAGSSILAIRDSQARRFTFQEVAQKNTKGAPTSGALVAEDEQGKALPLPYSSMGGRLQQILGTDQLIASESGMHVSDTNSSSAYAYLFDHGSNGASMDELPAQTGLGVDLAIRNGELVVNASYQNSINENLIYSSNGYDANSNDLLPYKTPAIGLVPPNGSTLLDNQGHLKTNVLTF